MEITKEQKLIEEIVTKAWEDSAFKEELKANPIASIEKHFGKKVKIAEGKTLVVKDQTDSSVVYINIPAKPDMDNVELSEEQLELVAGGADLPWYQYLTPGGMIYGAFEIADAIVN